MRIDMTLMELKDFIHNRIEKYYESSNYVKAYPATIVSVISDNTKADVKLTGDNTNIIQGLKNETGQTLAVGDEVYLFSPYSSISTAFIVYKNRD